MEISFGVRIMPVNVWEIAQRATHAEKGKSSVWHLPWYPPLYALLSLSYRHLAPCTIATGLSHDGNIYRHQLIVSSRTAACTVTHRGEGRERQGVVRRELKRKYEAVKKRYYINLFSANSVLFSANSVISLLSLHSALPHFLRWSLIVVRAIKKERTRNWRCDRARYARAQSEGSHGHAAIAMEDAHYLLRPRSHNSLFKARERSKWKKERGKKKRG